MGSMGEILFFKNLETQAERAHFLFQVAAHVKEIRSKLIQIRHEGNFDRDDIKNALHELHSIFHLKHHAIEAILENDKRFNDREALETILWIISILEVLPYLEELPHRTKAIIQLNKLKQRHSPLLSMFTIVWTKHDDAMSSQDQVLWRTIAASDKNPWCHFYARELIEPSEYVSKEESKIVLTSSQQKALDDLCSLYRAKAHKVRAAGIKPSTHALLIGSSGSGKSFIARSFARKYHFPIFEISLGSWILSGSRSDLPTMKRLSSWIKQKRHGVIFIDECEKLRPKVDHAEYTRYIMDEFMSLLDGRVEHIEGWNAESAEMLKHCFVICAAAFQQLYNEKLVDSKVCLNEQWEEISIREKIFDGTWLPDELIYRLSSRLIEIKPPSTDEIAQRLQIIHHDLELPLLSEHETQQKAQQLLRSKQNMRALESYITDQWIRRENTQIHNDCTQASPPPSKDHPPM